MDARCVPQVRVHRMYLQIFATLGDGDIFSFYSGALGSIVREKWGTETAWEEGE